MQITRLNPDGLDRCAAFYDFLCDKRKRDNIEAELREDKRRMYVCAEEGEFLGGVSISRLDEESVYLSYLVVRADRRNQGIGTELIEFSLKQAKKEGYRRVVLQVDFQNIDAMRLYLRLGFKDAKKGLLDRAEMYKDL